MKKTATEAKMM